MARTKQGKSKNEITHILELIELYFRYHENKPKRILNDSKFEKHPVWGEIAELQRAGLYDYAIAIWQNNPKLPESPNITNNPDEDMLNLKKWALAISRNGFNIKSTKKSEAQSKEAQALATLIEHKDWTNKKIASHIGLHEKSLSRYKKFKAAKAALIMEAPPKGEKKDGGMEAWER